MTTFDAKAIPRMAAIPRKNSVIKRIHEKKTFIPSVHAAKYSITDLGNLYNPHLNDSGKIVAAFDSGIYEDEYGTHTAKRFLLWEEIEGLDPEPYISLIY